jgi:hypothetical protein
MQSRRFVDVSTQAARGCLATALDVVDGEVREVIRRCGLDPFTDPGPVRVLVRDVVADYSERSLTSPLPPIGDPGAVVRDVLDRVAGFGPLQRYLDDPEVEEIWIQKRPTHGSENSRARAPGDGQPGQALHGSSAGRLCFATRAAPSAERRDPGAVEAQERG